jgi:hypothetical protein
MDNIRSPEIGWGIIDDSLTDHEIKTTKAAIF